MWPIIYRLIIPCGLCFIVFLIIAIHNIRAYSRCKNTAKNTKRKKLIDIVLSLLIVVFSFLFMAYCSQDLIYRDFITQQGIFEKQYRDREVYMTKLFFNVNGQQEYCHTFVSTVREHNFQKGQIYQFTYAKRTGMLLEISRIS